MSFIANLTGLGMFFISFGLAAVCLTVVKAMSLMDGSDSPNVPIIEGENSAFMTAILRSGKNGVLQILLYDLWKRHIIQIKGEGIFTRIKSNHNSLVVLDDIEEKIVQYVEIPRRPRELFESPVLGDGIQRCIDELYGELINIRLWSNEADSKRIAEMRTITFVSLIGLGILEMLSSFVLGNAFWPEVFVTLVSLAVAYGLFIKESGPTLLGRKYIANLTKSMMKGEELPEFDGLTQEDEVKYIAAFGIKALENSKQNAQFYSAFQKT